MGLLCSSWLLRPVKSLERTKPPCTTLGSSLKVPPEEGRDWIYLSAVHLHCLLRIINGHLRLPLIHIIDQIKVKRSSKLINNRKTSLIVVNTVNDKISATPLEYTLSETLFLILSRSFGSFFVCLSFLCYFSVRLYHTQPNNLLLLHCLLRLASPCLALVRLSIISFTHLPARAGRQGGVEREKQTTTHHGATRRTQTRSLYASTAPAPRRRINNKSLFLI